ncbi:CP family cyanate transporter-like MFS transporter [Microbacterium endophyticum]|uniref:CP family cyanate transporter-like MFS transporter n=1 Tax=Microbacterium endophyticum TaxID=1526412 RepID=A0A7W4V1Q3_9MICO|nr:MFS transporter [Microbacterium endophyticum]MBB2975253.1 CP family cyanate transporter-like MFS transporter [Microbacterium endophyticum]NIK35728.1 CP family cyanate transporter-like MFS transporter [Microbacterium endophyticum]
MASSLPRADHSRSRVIWILAAIVFTAAMLRSPVVAVAPVARVVEQQLGINATVLGLLTSVPVLAFAICAPLGVAIVRRGGANFALTLSLAGAVVGCVIRSSGELAAALLGTAIIGVFLTIGNVVMPVIIARDFPPNRVHTMTGVFTASLNIGTMTVTVSTAPLAGALGWRVALAASVAFGVAALATWIALHGIRGAVVPERRRVDASPATAAGSAAKHGTTWILGAAFAGQAFSFYAMTAWLPTLLTDSGFGVEAAGAIAGIFQVAGIAGALLVPLLTTRGSTLVAVVAVAAAWVSVPLGFLFFPQGWLLWCLLGGVAQGGGLTIIFIMIAGLGGGQRVIAGRSGLAQMIGYGIAAMGPTVVGALHEQTGDWVVSLYVVLAALLIFALAGGLVAGRLDRVPAPN